jgi:hypothetical protein
LGRQARHVLSRACRRRCRMGRDAAGEKVAAGFVRSRQASASPVPSHRRGCPARLQVCSASARRLTRVFWPAATTSAISTSGRTPAALRLPFCDSLEKRLAHRGRSTPARPCNPGLTIDMTGGAFALCHPVKKKGMHRFRGEASVISSRLPRDPKNSFDKEPVVTPAAAAITDFARQLRRDLHPLGVAQRQSNQG